MEAKPHICNKVACKVVAAAFIMIGMLMVVLGVTFLPGIGLVVALPIMWLSTYFLDLEAELADAREPASEVVTTVEHVEMESWCPWPAVPCCPLE